MTTRKNGRRLQRDYRITWVDDGGLGYVAPDYDLVPALRHVPAVGAEPDGRLVALPEPRADIRQIPHAEERETLSHQGVFFGGGPWDR